VTEFPVMDVFSVSRQELLCAQRRLEALPVPESPAAPDAKVLGLWYSRFYFLERPFEAGPAYEAPSVSRGAQARRSRGVRPRARGHGPHTWSWDVSDRLPGQQDGFDLLDDRVYPARQLRRDQALWNQFSTRYLERLPGRAGRRLSTATPLNMYRGLP
jgi:hypothetical protein